MSDSTQRRYTYIQPVQLIPDEIAKLENEMSYLVERDNGPDLYFEGALLGTVKSHENSAHYRYSGQRGMWAELSLYRTKSGRYVCHRIDYTIWQGRRNQHIAKAVRTEAEVMEFFGFDWLAKELYELAGIDAAVEVD